MLEQLRNKNTWKRTLRYFVCFFPFYAVIKYLFRDSDDQFFSFETFSNVLRFSLIMSLIFLFTFKPGSEPEYMESKEEIAGRKFSYYASFFVFMALILVVLGSVLLLAGLLIFSFISNDTLSARDFLKPIVVLIVMALLFTMYSFISDRLKLSKVE